MMQKVLRWGLKGNIERCGVNGVKNRKQKSEVRKQKSEVEADFVSGYFKFLFSKKL